MADHKRYGLGRLHRRLLRANDALNQADQPASLVARFGPDEPLLLNSGHRLDHLQIAYQTYGTLNAERSPTRSSSAMR